MSSAMPFVVLKESLQFLHLAPNTIPDTGENREPTVLHSCAINHQLLLSTRYSPQLHQCLTCTSLVSASATPCSVRLL
ncbi:hypothetical protein Scep_025549 [Stephania cephalantha]|uniref:Uncharacterized protein n=1 Tax=Stephania cephalantha TaxID=152367 RepID=A0AAP0HSJ4_9MAGN